MHNEEGLNPKQQAFVNEYIKDKNGTQAAIRAGYSKKTANEKGSQLLAIIKIREAINKRIKKIEEKALVDAEYVIKGLREVAERCRQKEAVMTFDYEEKRVKQVTEEVIDEKTGEKREEGVWKFDSHGANKAYELLGRYLKLFDKDGDKPAEINIIVKDFHKSDEQKD